MGEKLYGAVLLCLDGEKGRQGDECENGFLVHVKVCFKVGVVVKRRAEHAARRICV